MEPFVQLKGIAAPLPKVNVDTDAIIAVQHVYTLSKAGLGKYLFHRWRYAQDGSEVSEFVLNRQPFRQASIFVARANFGCGSSREHAVWAIRDFGFRVLISTSFADIFKENSLKNGVLTIEVDAPTHGCLVETFQKSPETEMTVDLREQTLEFGGVRTQFQVNSFSRTCLLEGLDELGYILRQEALIAAFEKARR